jgi:hypothetical protein
MVYSCKYCNFNSKLKGDYSRHLKTKKHMRNVCESGVGIQQVSNRYPIGIQEVSNKYPIGIQEVSSKYPVTVKSSKTHPFVCNLCNTQFTKKNNLYRHQKNRCKNNISQLNSDIETAKKELMKEYKLVPIKDYDKNVINNSNNNNNNNNNTTNNITNINNNNNITNNNIFQINTFGNEDMSFLTEKDKIEILECKRNGVLELVKRVYSQDNNKNFYVKNYRDKLAIVITEDNKIKHMDLDDLSSRIAYKNSIHMNNFYEEVKDKIDTNLTKVVSDTVCTNLTPENQDIYTDRIKFIILDNSDENKKFISKMMRESRKHNSKKRNINVKISKKESDNIENTIKITPI